MLHYTNDIDLIGRALTEMFGPNYPTKLPAKGDTLKSQRKHLHLTQDELADICGVPQPTISKIETSVGKNVETDAIYALSSALKCDLCELAEVPDHLITTTLCIDLDKVAPQIAEVAMVKTLAQPKARIDLRTFYYRTRLEYYVEDDNVPNRRRLEVIEVTRLEDIGSHHALIQGVAGQGKSVFLRYLALRTLENRTSLPLYIELRHLHEETILSAVVRRLDALGYKASEKQVGALFREGSISLFLDGYDELNPAFRPAFMRDLEKLHVDYPRLRVVITSRPNTGLVSHNNLSVYQIAILEASDLVGVVRCYANKEEALRVSEHVRSVSVEIRGLLSSPLMILLLLIHFRYTESIPESTVAFYKDLLDVLLRRHNSSAAGPIRPITSGLKTPQLGTFFESLSYLVGRDYDDADIHLSDLQKTAIKALELAGLEATPEKSAAALDDVISITNLIVEEEGYCRFIHKSVKEYFAAAFVASLTSLEHSDTFYSSVRKKWSEWEGELSFLQIIDRMRWLKFFCIPDLKQCKPFNRKTLWSQFAVLNIKSKKSGKDAVAQLADSQAYCLRNESPTIKFDSAQKLSEVFSPELAKWILAELRRGSPVHIDRRIERGSLEKHVLQTPMYGGCQPRWSVNALIDANDDYMKEHRLNLEPGGSPVDPETHGHSFRNKLRVLQEELDRDDDRKSEFEV